MAQTEEDKEKQGDGKSEKAGRLRTGHETEYFFRVVAAQKFQTKPGSAVQHDIEGEALSPGMAGTAEHQQQGEDHHIQLTFPYFGRPERLCAVGMSGQCSRWVNDAEGTAGRGAEGIPIQKIGTASQCLSEDDGRSQCIHEADGIEMMAAAVQDSCDYAEYNSTLNGHAALPDIEQFGEMVAVIPPVKEKDIPKTCADQAGNAAVNPEIDEVLFIAVSFSLSKKIAGPSSQNDGQREYESVSADGKIADKKQILMHKSLPHL